MLPTSHGFIWLQNSLESGCLSGRKRKRATWPEIPSPINTRSNSRRPGFKLSDDDSCGGGHLKSPAAKTPEAAKRKLEKPHSRAPATHFAIFQISTVATKTTICAAKVVASGTERSGSE
ncbi:uncharacterized protein LOC119549480 [Drosophila subpulchrella]|uniref:uncharacterized protein LOC119549480 n=1 Tax=Drosophila subpulchrella TaxID=1486046 RepID=UPI0018A187D0|nr:uncharacterized protein LOC119549480 [Drosophila subpulchrella]